MFDQFLDVYTQNKEKLSNADSVNEGDSKSPPELFASDSDKIIPYEGDAAIENEKLKLLNKCKKLSAHVKSYKTLDDAIKQASYLAIMFAEADEKMYKKEIEDAEAGLENAKEGVKHNRFTYNEEVDKFRRQRTYFREKLSNLKKSRDLRGHSVEWSAVVVMDKNGKYRAIGATPGGRKRFDGESQPADDIYASHLHRAGYKNMKEVKAVIHTHPRFGDRHQARIPKNTGSSGLYPSDNDRKQDGVQAMINQRGKIVKYNQGEQDEILKEGIDKNELKKNEYGAITSIKKVENAEDFEEDMAEITKALSEIDRQKLEDFQENI